MATVQGKSDRSQDQKCRMFAHEIVGRGGGRVLKNMATTLDLSELDG